MIIDRIRRLEPEKMRVFLYYGNHLLSLIESGSIDLVVKKYDRAQHIQQAKRKIQSKSDEVISERNKLEELSSKNTFEVLNIEEEINGFNIDLSKQLKETEKKLQDKEDMMLLHNINKQRIMKFKDIIKEHIMILRKENESIKNEIDYHKKDTELLHQMLVKKLELSQLRGGSDERKMDVMNEELFMENQLHIDRNQLEDKMNYKDIKNSLFKTMKFIIGNNTGTNLEKFLRQMLNMMLIIKI